MLKVQGTVISMKWTSDTDITKWVELRCLYSELDALKLYDSIQIASFKDFCLPTNF